MTLQKKFAKVLLGLSIACASSQALALKRFPLVGGSGGQPFEGFNQRTPVAALEVNSGKYIDRIVALSGNQRTIFSAGGEGGWLNYLQCDSGDVAVGIVGRAAKYVDQIGLICGVRGNLSQTYTTIRVGGEGGSSFIQKCRRGSFIVGMYGRAAKYIDAVGIICNR
ncbi:hypothetical protein [Pseudobacteriovorax antillogorgiicola]|uniref:Jacalin-like lectin domain-containing protein n=1 Tax=Pseudobacteriovorax antillogorgiicola TaxID=1513793 RepID=A0A1Y6CQW9_9BACT|nr:hypothetical protein [Pseudobacteriovorax antillogorgiicola]TCS40908.1 hypothetical protein EDD56_1527 [Pseudobacteriovorax antillogorgiicola]SMF84104.1 hypothetical protein SAMN06296036_1527 [Pseudobacteriovorax antillogorgiicola]